MSDTKLNRELACSEENQGSLPRRHFLRNGLAAVAGMVAGYSILADTVSAAQTLTAPLKVQPRLIRVPTNLKYTVKTPTYRVFQTASQKELVTSISPLLSQMVEEAGMKLDQGKTRELQRAFEERGLIRVAGRGSAADVNVKISGSLSVSW